MLTEHQTVLERDPRRLPPPPPSARPGRPPFAERARRASLLVVGALLCGGIVAAYPWYGSVTLLLLVWLLRSGSLAASAAGARRRQRGPKWYDGAQLLVRAPWELLRTLAGTVMLQLWSAGLAVAAALLCYAFVAGETVTLFVCGTVFAAAVWTGPGGSRVRSPLSRVVNPALAPVEAVAGRHLRPAGARHRARRARRVARHVVVARERPSAERTDPRTLSQVTWQDERNEPPLQRDHHFRSASTPSTRPPLVPREVFCLPEES